MYRGRTTYYLDGISFVDSDGSRERHTSTFRDSEGRVLAQEHIITIRRSPKTQVVPTVKQGPAYIRLNKTFKGRSR